MESEIYPGYTAFDDKALDPGRYIIQVDLADVETEMPRIHDSMCGLVTVLLRDVPTDTALPLDRPVSVHTLNKGHDFTCEGFKRRADGCVMMVGEYCGKHDEEFLSHVHGYEQDKKVLEAVFSTFGI